MVARDERGERIIRCRECGFRCMVGQDKVHASCASMAEAFPHASLPTSKTTERR